MNIDPTPVHVSPVLRLVNAAVKQHPLLVFAASERCSVITLIQRQRSDRRGELLRAGAALVPGSFETRKNFARRCSNRTQTPDDDPDKAAYSCVVHWSRIFHCSPWSLQPSSSSSKARMEAFTRSRSSSILSWDWHGNTKKDLDGNTPERRHQNEFCCFHLAALVFSHH